MAIITLTTDFGTTDFYVARFKGLILSGLTGGNLIDVSHDVDNFDIQSAAFQVKHTWKSFPQHSIHLVWVGDQYSTKNYWIACKYQKHFFILPNNGLITLILGASPEQVVQLQNKENLPTDAFLAKVIGQIAHDQSILGVGEHSSNYLERLSQQPVVSGGLIRGSVQHVDKYGNLITNINRALFADQLRERRFRIVTRAEQFDRIHGKYADVEGGEKVAFFNSQDLLQLSINRGNANHLLGLKVGDAVQVEFL